MNPLKPTSGYLYEQQFLYAVAQTLAVLNFERIDRMDVSRVSDFVGRKLNESFDSLNNWLSLDFQITSRKPAVGWSILDILEHITLTNHFLLILIEKGTDKSLKAEDVIVGTSIPDDHFATVDEIGVHQLFVWHRPDHMEPTGKMSLTDISEKLRFQHDQCFRVLNKIRNGEGLRYKTTMTVHNLGKIDVYQYLYFLARHIDRHVMQMQSRV